MPESTPAPLPTISAELLARHTTSPPTHTSLTLPTWLSTHDEYISTTRSAPTSASTAPYTVRWSSGDTARTALSTRTRPRGAPALALLPALSASAPALCAATADFVHVCAPGGALHECPLPAAVGRGAAFSQLWPTAKGLVVEVRERDRRERGGRYFALLHPLEESLEVGGLPKGERFVFASRDVGVVVTVGKTGWTIWAVEEVIVTDPIGSDVTRGTGSGDAASTQADGARDGDHVAMDLSDSFGEEEMQVEDDPTPDPAVDTKPDPDAANSFGACQTCLSLRRVHSVNTPTSSDVSCLIAHSLSGEVLLCVVANTKLSAFSLSLDPDAAVTAATHVFDLPDVAAAVGISATRESERAVDILALSASCSALTLYVDRFAVCNVALKGSGDTEYVRALTEPVGSRATAVLADGMAVRFSLRSLSPTSTLVNRCLATLSRAWLCRDGVNTRGGAESPALLIRRRLILRRVSPRGVEFSEDPAGRDLDWLCFVDELVAAARAPGRHQPSPHSRPTKGNMEIAFQGSGTEVDDDWNYLLSSEHHKMSAIVGMASWCSKPVTEGRTGFALSGEKRPDNAEDVLALPLEVQCSVLEALHLLCEDMKLNVLAKADRSRLASCIVELASAIGATDYADYYLRQYEHLAEDFVVDGASVENSHSLVRTPEHLQPLVSIFEYLCRHVQRWRDRTECCSESDDVGLNDEVQLFPFLQLSNENDGEPHSPHLLAEWRAKSPLRSLERVVQFYDILFNLEEKAVDPADSTPRPLRMLRAMCHVSFGPRDLDALPFGVALPLREALWACRNTPGENLPVSGEVLVGREDLWGGSKDGCVDEQADVDGYRALLRMRAASATYEQRNEMQTAGAATESGGRGDADGGEEPEGGDARDGCSMAGAVFDLRFSDDRRVSEVRRLLSSADPVLLHMARVDPDAVEDLPDGERPNEQLWLAKQLSNVLKRHMASPIGRGAFTLRTLAPSDPTEPLNIPNLCLIGKVAGQKGSKVTFNPDAASYCTDWGEFHNGVAAGLRLVASDSSSPAGSSSGDGVSVLTRTWIVNHRPSNTAGNASHAGMLLALGLGGHLPALRATDYYEYLVPMHDLTTIGLMLGVAAGNRASLHAKVTKMLCVHIRHFNGPGFAVPDFHVSLIVQAAAVVGLGLLYQGTSEHLIVEGLLVELTRRPQPGDDVRDREGLSLAAGIGLGLVCLGVGSSMPALADLRLVDTLCLYAIGGADPSTEGGRGLSSSGGGVAMMGLDSHHPGSAKPPAQEVGAMPPSNADSETSRVRLGNFINVDVTGPGSLLALALVYLQTNDSNVAHRIVIPNTMYALDRARPDHVYMRCLAKHLIMWDSIQPTREWVLSTLPPLLQPPAGGKRSGIDLTRVFNDEIDSDAKGNAAGDAVDEDGIILARAFAVAAACIAIALRNAGSMNSTVMKLLVSFCVDFEAALLRHVEDNEESEWVFSSCLSLVCLGLSIVAAGSGDLDALRLFRRIRRRSGPSLRKSRYGTHMAMHMAIGFLFLGGGCQTFGTSKIAVASLLCAIHPRFPCDVEDNQYHLQALRHLYVLAVEPRCIEARDVDTDLPCSVSIEVKMKDTDQSLTMTAPCLVPDARLVEHLSVVSERYWPKVVRVRSPGQGVEGWFSPTQRQILYVKRRAGHLPHAADPTGSKGMLARSFRKAQRGDAADTSVAHLVRAFSADPHMLAFVRHFCDFDSNGDPSGLPDRYGHVLYECLSHDKPEAVECYLEIERALSALKGPRMCPTSLNSLALLSEYATLRPLWGHPPLVRRDFLSYVALVAREAFKCTKTIESLSNYVQNCTGAAPLTYSGPIGRALQLYRVPPPTALAGLRKVRQGNVEDAWAHFASSIPRGTPDSAIELLVDSLT